DSRSVWIEISGCSSRSAIPRRCGGSRTTTTRTGRSCRRSDLRNERTAAPRGARSMNRTLFEKVWSEHVIVTSPQGEDLLYVDFNLINEGQSFLAFDQLRKEGRRARRPQQHLAVTDHYLPTVNRSLGPAGISNPEIRRVVEMLDENAAELALPHIGWHHRDQGIAHVIAPELGLAQPGMLITCNDSHTATNGACGALAIPIGGSNQLRHVLATQTVWLKKPKTMRIGIEGMLPPAGTPQDRIP